MRLKAAVVSISLFLIGFGSGGYLFSKTLPRSFLPTSSCGDHCYSMSEVAGLVTSLGVQKVPFLVHGVILESDSCLTIRYPRPKARIHYVLFPKHDIKNIATLTPEDMTFVEGCFAMVRVLVKRDHLKNYTVLTNGPGKQEIAYLHFHLIAD